MENTFKNFLYTGVGLMAMTAEKIQHTIDKLVAEGKLSMEEGKKVVAKLEKEGKISSEDGKKMMDNFIKNAKIKKGELETQMKGIAERVIGSFNFATEKELTDLKKRVAVLEAKLKATNKPPTPMPKKPEAKKQKPLVKPETV